MIASRKPQTRNRTAILGAALSFLCLVFVPQFSQAQSIDLEYSQDAQHMAEQITGNGVQLINPILTCADSASGVFIVESLLEFPNGPGVMLSTGDIQDLRGPNLSESTTTEWDTPGDPLLTTISGQTSFDGCALEFDVVPAGDTLRFNFTFASEEYSEYVGTPFNDVFGFFIKGPGITGDPTLDDYENIAIIPGTNDAVGINTVNGGNPDIGFPAVNPEYYHNNPLGFSNLFQFDGWTVGLSAIHEVIPCDTFHLKLVIADVGDREWDSAVLIEDIESSNTSLSLVTVGGIETLIEGCNDGTVSFTREPVTDQPVDVIYYLQGTAQNGVDYPLVGGDPDPDSPKLITILANEATATIDFFPYDDGIDEGDETVAIYIGNPDCEATVQDSLIFIIQDELELSIEPTIAFICLGDSLTFDVDGQGDDFSWSPADYLNDPNIQEPTTTPTDDIIYTLISVVSGCIAEATAEINVTDMQLSADITNITCGGTNEGAIDLTQVGGQSPIEYAWVGPNGFSADTEDIDNLEPGTYVVLVTDRDGCTASLTVEISENPPLTADLSSPTFPGGDNISCFSGSDGQITATVNGGSPPFDFLWDDTSNQTSQTATELSAGTYTVTITDSNDCITQSTLTITQPDIITATLVNRVNVLCAGESTGSAEVVASGGHATYEYQWNTIPPQAGPLATGLAAGIYTVTITDINNCSGTTIVEIEEPDAPLSGSVATLDPGCFGDASGIANATINGGTDPYTYIWSADEELNNPTITGLSAGNYSLTIIDDNGCELTIPFNISEPTSLSLAILSQENVACNGGNGSVSVSANGGTTPYSFSWDTDPITVGPDLNDIPAGTYTVTVTDGNACTTDLEVIITEPEALVLNIDAVVEPQCFDSEDGSISLSASGGTEPYAFVWDIVPPLDNPVLGGIGAGSYDVTITDANGCSITASIPLGAPTAVQVTIESVVHVLCAGEATGSATISVIGGTPDYTITWDDLALQTGPTASNLLAGEYTATIEDANGCLTSISVTITEPEFALSAIISASQDILCFGDATGSATVIASGGSGSYSYLWNDPNSQQTYTASGLQAGSYTVTVTDNNGCATPIILNIDILGPAASLDLELTPSLFSGGFNLACAEDENATIDLTINGGTGPFDVLWNLPGAGTSTDQNLTDLPPGEYAVLVTDSNGCVSTASITLVAPEPIEITSTTTPSLCFGSPTGSISITIDGGVPAYDVSWIGPNGFVSSDLDLVNLEGGIYDLTITDDNGCVYIDVVTVTQPEDIVITVDAVSDYNGFNTTCWNSSDGEIYTTPSGGLLPYSIQWNTAGSPNFSNQEDVTGLQPGLYEVVVTDDNGCVQNEFITLIAPDTIDIDFDASLYANGFNISCFGAADGSVEALPTGGTPDYSYTWIGPSFGPTSDNPIENLGPGEYSVLVTDDHGCIIAESITLTQPDEFGIQLIAEEINGVNISCNGLSDGTIDLILLGGSAPFLIEWTGPNGFVSNDEDLFNLEAGEYCVVVTDANDCVQSACITLTEPLPIVVTLTPTVYVNGANLNCADSQDGIIATEVTGGTAPYTAAWTGPNNFTSNEFDLVALHEGTYCLTTTDANNCSQTTCVTLIAPDPIEIIEDLNTPPSCNGDFDGVLEVSVVGGDPAFDYSWIGPNGFTSTDEDLSGLEAGVYCLEITDANACTSQACFTVNTPEVLNANITASEYEGGFEIQCAGTFTGSISAIGLGGIEPYTYTWTGPNGFTADEATINDLEAGTYCIDILDVNDCFFQTCIDLTEPLVLETAPVVTLPDCNDGSLATIDLNVSGGVEPYTFNWNTPDNTEVIEVGQGNYSVIISDANGCEQTESFSIILPDPITVIPSSPEFGGGYNLSCNGDNTGSISIVIFGGAGALTSEWTGPNGFTSSDADITDLEAGTYCITVTDELGCMGDTCITLTEPDALGIDFAATDVTCNGLFDGSLSATITGGVPIYDVSWTGPNGFTDVGPELTGLEAGTYCATITDFNNCIAISCFDIAEPDPIGIVLSSPEIGGINILCFGDNSGSIDAVITGGTTPFSFIWTGPNGYSSDELNIAGLYAGEYCLTVTDANNCEATECITLTESPGIDIVIDVFEYPNGFNTSCGGICDGSLEATLTGGALPVAFSWVGPNGFTSDQLILTDLCAGAYTLHTIDADGCEQESTVVLTEPETIDITLDSPVFGGGLEISCFGANTGTILTTLTGGLGDLTYSWTGPDGFTSDQPNLADLFAGTYDLLVTDADGCSNTASITLNEPAEPLDANATPLEYSSGHNISCKGANNGIIASSATGGTSPYIFNWSGPNGFISDQAVISDLQPGLYVLVIEDANSCVQTIEITITEPSEELTSELTVNAEILCAEGSNASLSVTATGGSPDYEIIWTGPNGFTSDFFNLSDLSEGTYAYVVTDINGCTSTGAYTFIAPLPIVVTADIIDADCETATGIIDLTVSGGTPAFTYLWSNDDITQDLINVTAGDYDVTIEDDNGCIFQDSYTINSFTSLNIDATISDLLCFEDGSGIIEVEPNPGVEPITYTWIGPDGFEADSDSIGGLQAGDYTLLASDLNGCTFEETYTVGQPEELVIEELFSPVYDNGYNLSAFESGNGIIETAKISGGTEDYNYVWSSTNGYVSPDSASNQLNLSADEYLLVITDANGCVDSASITLTQPIPFDIPNGISPNGDGNNDGLIVRGLDDYPVNKFMVFNRWGNTVYEEDNYNNMTPWYGTNKDGQDIPEGTYFVIIEVDGVDNLKGYLELRR